MGRAAGKGRKKTKKQNWLLTEFEKKDREKKGKSRSRKKAGGQTIERGFDKRCNSNDSFRNLCICIYFGSVPFRHYCGGPHHEPCGRYGGPDPDRYGDPS